MKEFREFHSKDGGIFFRISRLLVNKKTRFQKILLFENPTYGKVLTLDNLVMLTEKDEYFYHESLVHPALCLISKPGKVLIIGGGDGKTAFEVFKHAPEEVHLVEIDEEVIEVSRKHFKWSCVFDRKRLKIFIDDGVKFVKNGENKYDVVIVDSSDPVGPAKRLYTKDFYINLKNILNKKGILIIQAESPVYHRNIQKKIYRQLSRIFRICEFYLSPMPTYPGGMWAYLFCSDHYHPLKSAVKRIPRGLKFYSKKVHRALFELANFIK